MHLIVKHTMITELLHIAELEATVKGNTYTSMSMHYLHILIFGTPQYTYTTTLHTHIQGIDFKNHTLKKQQQPVLRLFKHMHICIACSS